MLYNELRLPAIQLTVAHSFGDVRAADGFAAGQVGDGAGDLEHAVIGARRQAQTRHRCRQQGLRGGFRHAVAFDFAHRQPRVRPAAALQLEVAAADHPLAHLRAALGIGLPRYAQRVGFDPWHEQLQVDAVEQRAGDACAIAADLVGRAAAFAGAVAEITAGT